MEIKESGQDKNKPFSEREIKEFRFIESALKSFYTENTSPGSKIAILNSRTAAEDLEAIKKRYDNGEYESNDDLRFFWRHVEKLLKPYIDSWKNRIDQDRDMTMSELYGLD